MNTFPIYNIHYIAQAYECGTYGADSYNETLCDVTQPISDALANTGVSFWATLATGVILIILPLAYVYSRAIKRRQSIKK